MTKLALALCTVVAAMVGCTSAPTHKGDVPPVNFFPNAYGAIDSDFVSAKYLNKHLLEQFELGHAPGAPAVHTDVTDWTEQQLKEELQSERGGMYITGRIKTYRWASKGVDFSHSMAEVVYWDDLYSSFIHGWFGGHPDGSKYFATSIGYQIDGHEPKIKGKNYEWKTNQWFSGSGIDWDASGD